jgi:biotin operon repressor
MRYKKSLEIEQRLAEALRLIQTGQYSTPMLAEQLDVSIPTVSRYVTALRERGHDIRAMKAAGGWRFVLACKHDARPKRKETLEDITRLDSLYDDSSAATMATVDQSGAPKG